MTNYQYEIQCDKSAFGKIKEQYVKQKTTVCCTCETPHKEQTKRSIFLTTTVPPLELKTRLYHSSLFFTKCKIIVIDTPYAPATNEKPKIILGHIPLYNLIIKLPYKERILLLPKLNIKSIIKYEYTDPFGNHKKLKSAISTIELSTLMNTPELTLWLKKFPFITKFKIESNPAVIKL